MFSVRKAFALAGATAVMVGLGVSGPAQAAPVDDSPTVSKQSQKEGGGDVGIVKNSATSQRQIRVWKDDNCPKTLEGFKRSAVVYEGEWAPFLSVGSVWMGKSRVLKSSYWLQTWKTGRDSGRCVNLTTSPTTVLTYKVRKYKVRR